VTLDLAQRHLIAHD